MQTGGRRRARRVEQGRKKNKERRREGTLKDGKYLEDGMPAKWEKVRCSLRISRQLCLTVMMPL